MARSVDGTSNVIADPSNARQDEESSAVVGLELLGGGALGTPGIGLGNPVERPCGRSTPVAASRPA